MPGMMQQYYQTIQAMLARVMESQGPVIAEAGRLGAEAIRGGGLIHAFGTGHSHLLAEEVFARAGGLLPVNAILEPSLMLHEGSRKSGLLERMEGFAERLLALEPLSPGDLMIIASNSGRNAVPVEAAMFARQQGLKVVAVTSLAHSRSQPPNHPSGKRLFELADVVIDNMGLPGDAAVEVPGLPVRACATSTVIGAFIVQAIAAEVVDQLVAMGVEPPVLQSGNVEGGKEHNQRVMEAYGPRLTHLQHRLR